MGKKYQDLLDDQNYINIVKDLLGHAKVLEMSNYNHHGNINCLDHSLNVSYMAYQTGLKLKLNSKALARAGLLHDFYLYDWHVKGERKGLHGFTHAMLSLTNALQYFELTSMEQDMIKKHMWPLNPSFPKYKETLVIMYADRMCTILESLKVMSKQDLERIRNVGRKIYD